MKKEGTDFKPIKKVIANILRVFSNQLAGFRLNTLFDEKISPEHQISSGLLSSPFGKIEKNAELKTEPCPSKHP